MKTRKLFVITAVIAAFGVLFAACKGGGASRPAIDTVAMPTVSPNGGTHTGTQHITLNCSTEGASIYYTIDETPPSASSTLYTGAFDISETTTVKAIAVKAGMTTSTVYTVVITISDDGEGGGGGGGGSGGSGYAETVATPTATPAAGTYSVPQNVTISCATAEASIHYTLDGSTPTATSPLYSGAISIDATSTLKAMAMKGGMNHSATLTAEYTIGKSITITGIPPGMNGAEVEIVIGIEDGPVAVGFGTVSGGSLSCPLVIDEHDTPFTGSGLYILEFLVEPDRVYIYTNGKTAAELGISPEDPTSEELIAKLPRYDITSTVSTIAFNLFFEITESKTVAERFRFSDGSWLNSDYTRVTGANFSLTMDTLTITGGGVNFTANNVYTEGGGPYDNPPDLMLSPGSWAFLYSGTGKIGIVVASNSSNIQVWLGKSMCEGPHGPSFISPADTADMANSQNGSAINWSPW